MLEVSNVYFSYNKKNILSNVNFKLDNGDFLAIVGHNGSGKSTLIKCLLGENKLASGDIKINDISIRDFKNWEQIGYLSQSLFSFTFHFPITVNEFLKAYSKTKNTKHIQAILGMLNINALLYENLNSLSGGQLQRIFIAKTLINDPDILIFDEPVDGMDEKSIHFFYDYLGKLKSLGKIIIVVTHNIETCAKAVSHVLSLSNNKAIFSVKEDYFNTDNSCKICGDNL